MCVSSWRLPSKENLPQKWFWVFARCLISVCVCVDGRHTCKTQSRNRCVADIWMKMVAFQARGGRAGSWGRLTYCSGCSRETLQVRGRRWRWSTEHLCHDVTAENWWIRTWTCWHEMLWIQLQDFLWSVLTYIWFIYNTTLFISSLNLKKTLHWWFLLNSTEHDVCSDLTDRWSSVCMCREVCVIIFSPTEPRPNRTSG